MQLVTLDGSLRTLDGGGKRVQAFLRALEAREFDVDIAGVGPLGTDEVDRVVSSPLHRLKRRLLPVAFRRRIESQLAVRNNRGPTISLIPSANRWALRSKPNWLDYPDLWSNMARTQARAVDPVSACSNLMQAQLWARREATEYGRADVVSAASWSDRMQMGERAVWLPTPVAESVHSLTDRKMSPSPSHGVVYGFIGNFGYPPNRDAYQRLIRHWAPVLSPVANRIVVAGFGSEDLPRVASVDIIGPVDDVVSFYDAVDVVLAPIELGGGMKVKVVEAMIHGIPVVATEHAKEGLPRAIAQECVGWESFSSALRDQTGPIELKDPRENPAVASELEMFTFDSFRRVFDSIWQERMAALDPPQ